MAYPRRVIADEQVEYKAGENIYFNYIFIFSVWKDSDFEKCGLSFSDGQGLDLSPFLEIPDNFTLTALDEEKGTVLSGEDNQAFGENAVIGAALKIQLMPFTQPYLERI